MDAIIDALLAHADGKGDKPAFIAADEAVSFRDLARRVVAAAAWSVRLPNVIGLVGVKTVDWVVADLALAMAGKTVVPLPDFFSEDQLRHIVADAGVEHILHTTTEFRDLAHGLGLPAGALGYADGPQMRRDAAAKRIIYTSGTTGRPKGVRLSARQINFLTVGLARAAAARDDDVSLSLLPYAMLLEQIAGAYVPLVAGASVHLDTQAFAHLMRGNPQPLIDSFSRVPASVTVLVPEMLSILVAARGMSAKRARESLRFVAVGGAPVSPSLADLAWTLGIPVHEGYGLSECCSVVSVNHYGARRSGTVGTPLAGVGVAIDNGEIVVSGPSVMDGYLGGDPAASSWRTGDVGSIDDDGFLSVDGRKDNIIVTALGRNVSPEWIESGFQSDPRIGRAIAYADGAFASILLIPSPSAQPIFAAMDSAQLDQVVQSNCRHVPSYARPRRVVLLDEHQVRTRGFLTANGKPNRARIAQQFGNAT